MGVKLIQESTLTDIADALRTVYSMTDKIDPAAYASFIKGLEVSSKGLLLSKIAMCANNGNLDSISWNEIDEISAALVDGTLKASDVNALLGLSKSFTYGSATCYAFIIGILQDYLDSTPRGFTFWCVKNNSPFTTTGKILPITYLKFSSSDTNTGGWGSSDVLRTALQSGGSIYNAMPSDMTAVMKSKTTHYGPTYNSTSTSVSSVTDIMFIPSEKEVFNINNASEVTDFSDTPFWQYEGTGAEHNEQYQLFANEGIAYDNFSKLNCYMDYYWWLRTCYYSNSLRFMRVGSGGNPDTTQYASNIASVTPCFCV